MFNSRNRMYRNPTGAVKTDESVHFRITLPREIHCTAAYLLIERDNGDSFCLDMFWCGMNGVMNEWWECHFIPEEIGLYFYHFELKTDHGRRRLSRGYGGEAIPQGYDKWQLTVYHKDYSVPKWLQGGIMYQIFPDRFHRSENAPDIHDLPKEYSYRKIHDHWGDLPDWLPNANGRIENDDFFGGSLKGIEEKLPYIAALGATCIYLNPIFEAHSNHRYDTADYSKIDPMLGTEEDFRSLCETAGRFGICILLDGVFSHTGSDSLYFNRDGRYEEAGAYNSQSSRYFSWYHFTQWPDQYDTWWGFDTLPNVNEHNPEFMEYINGEKGIVRKWIAAGAAGWRLDVADELPDEFIDSLNKAAKAESTDALILGEVWEDASSKTAYGIRRRYLLGGQLDTVMNYPFRDAILTYLLGGDAASFFEQVESILENYPPCCIHSLMNHIGTHDTERAITVLAGEPVHNHDRKWQSEHSLSPNQRVIGLYKMRLASLIQYTLPGIPCVYYGDEIGLEGYKDPFNRKTYPWDDTENDLMLWYRTLGRFRTGNDILSDGSFRKIFSQGDVIAFERYQESEAEENVLLVLINRGGRILIVDRHIISQDCTLLLGTDIRQEDYELEPFGYAVYEYTRLTTVQQTEDTVTHENDGTKIAML